VLSFIKDNSPVIPNQSFLLYHSSDGIQADLPIDKLKVHGSQMAANCKVVAATAPPPTTAPPATTAAPPATTTAPQAVIAPPQDENLMAKQPPSAVSVKEESVTVWLRAWQWMGVSDRLRRSLKDVLLNRKPMWQKCENNIIISITEQLSWLLQETGLLCKFDSSFPIVHY